MTKMNEIIVYHTAFNRILRRDEYTTNGCYCCMSDHDSIEHELFELNPDTKEWDYLDDSEVGYTIYNEGNISLYSWDTKRDKPPYPQELFDLYLTYM